MGRERGKLFCCEFHICVTPVGQDEYLVQTEKVAPGVPLAQELVTWPVADWLTQTEQLMNNPLQGNARSLNSVNLVNLGQQLYSALFQGSLQASWMTAQEIALQQQQVLRLRLGLKETKLARLPWEALHSGECALATAPYLAFSRYQAGITSAAQSRAGTIGAVKVLILQAELGLRDRLMAVYRDSFNLQFTVLEQPGREQLTQALEQGQYQVLHYVGYGNLGTLSKDDLANLLVNNGIQMAVFNSCLSANTATRDEPIADVSNLTHLVKRGIRSVLAIGGIPDEVALTLTRLFYLTLSQGYAVDLSLNRALRELISTYGSHHLYLPILYLQPDFDGYLTPSETSLPQLDRLLTKQDSLGEEDWEEGIDEIEDDDPSYKDDSALVSELFRQVVNPTAFDSPILPPVLDQLPDVAKQEEVALAATATPAPTFRLQAFAAFMDWVQRVRGTSSWRVWLVSGVAGSAAIALSLWSQNRSLQLGNLLPQEAFLNQIPRASLPNPVPIDLKTATTSVVTQIAIEQFNKGNLSGGCLAVEELLNRGTLPSAEAALNAVSQQQAQASDITFLRGRLAWQSVQIGDKNYSLDDARRYWEAAVKENPDIPLYHNALGFAYYAQGNLNLANQTWFQALYLVEEQQAKKTARATTPAPTSSVANRDALNAYAGLALVLSKAAQNQLADDEQQAKLLSEAIQLRQKVLIDDAVNFQPQTLGKNWLWTQKAIRDWRSLQKAKNRGVIRLRVSQN